MFSRFQEKLRKKNNSIAAPKPINIWFYKYKGDTVAVEICSVSSFLAHSSQVNSCLFPCLEDKWITPIWMNKNDSNKLVAAIQVKILCAIFPGLNCTRCFLGKMQNGWRHKLLHKLLHKVKVFGQTPDPWCDEPHEKKTLGWLTDSCALMRSGHSLWRQTVCCDSSVLKTFSYCQAWILLLSF